MNPQTEYAVEAAIERFGWDEPDADSSDRPCSTCGATETVEISDDRNSLLVCAECGSDEP